MENEYVMNALSPNKLSRADEQTRLKALVIAISEVYKFRGQQPNAEDSIDMARSLSRKIVSNGEFDPTIEEVRTAFEYGVTGEYGEYYGINYVTLWKWVKAYINSQERLDALAAYKRRKQAQNQNLLPEKSESQRREESRRMAASRAVEFWRDVRDLGQINASYHAQDSVYRLLRAEGVMPKPSDEALRGYLAKATDTFNNPPRERTLLMTIDDAWDSQHGTTDNEKIARIARALALRDFLKGLESAPDIK